MRVNDIYNDYKTPTDSVSANKGYFIPHDRNVEGFEMQFLGLFPQNKDARILDIGCGWGQLLHMLKQQGYTHLEGIDLGAQQVEVTRKLDIPAERIDDLGQYLDIHQSRWDVITLSQVIEHFPKDKLMAYLVAVRKALRSGGRLLIATPNMALATGLVQRYTDVTHEIGFTERSLKQALRVAGFSHIDIQGERLPFKPRLKYLVWLVLRNIWFKLLAFIYLLEKGTDRPKIISRHLIASAQK